MTAFVKKLGLALVHPDRALRRCWQELRQVASRRTIRRATRSLRRRRKAGTASPVSRSGLSEYLGVILSYKIAAPQRLAMLAVTLQTLKRALQGTAVPVRVIDASGPPFVSQVKPLFAQIELPCFYEATALSLCAAYLQMLRASEQRYTYVQLDDAVTLGMSPEFFQSACALLDKYEGILNVVSIELPRSVEVVETERVVDIVMCRQRNGRRGTDFSFGMDPPLRLLWREKIGEYEFGIFENRYYGFYIHNLVVPTQDYANRLEWYMQNTSQSSVHAIELAAADRTMGPYWTHLAICLSKVCMVDLDFAPSPGAVRPPNDRNRVVMEALRAGYGARIRCETMDDA